MQHEVEYPMDNNYPVMSGGIDSMDIHQIIAALRCIIHPENINMVRNVTRTLHNQNHYSLNYKPMIHTSSWESMVLNLHYDGVSVQSDFYKRRPAPPNHTPNVSNTLRELRKLLKCMIE
jgi:hypothetical protein